MRSHQDVARVLVAVDLSGETSRALRCAEGLRATRPAVIEVYYLWSDGAAPQGDAADDAYAAIASYARTAGAWDCMDHLNGLARRGVLAVSGWLTRACRGGSSLAGLAARQGYDIVVVGLAQPPQPSHRFDLHRLAEREASCSASY